LEENGEHINYFGKLHKFCLNVIIKGKTTKRASEKSIPQPTISFLYSIFRSKKKLLIKKTRGKKTIANVKNFQPRTKSAIKQA